MEERRSPAVIEDSPHDSQNDVRADKPQHPPRRWPWVVAAVLIVLGVGYYYLRPGSSGTNTGAPTATASGKAGRGGGGAMPVVAAKARKGDIGVYFDNIGTVTSIYTVSVKSRVDGELMKVLYREGEIVHQGDRLLEIDPRPFEAQLTQFQGLLQRDQALLDNARLDLARYETLVKQDAVPEQQAATQRALVKQYQGAVENDQGQIDTAKLNITYSHVDAPITGQIGLRLVDPGNIVHASDANGLLVITQVQPISVIFPIVEDQLPTVLQKLRGGQRLEVDAYDRAKINKIAQGWLATVDNQIDPTTGTVRLRATFDNRNNALFPNQFINARLLVEEKHGVTLAPSAVIQRGAQSTYVYVVEPDSPGGGQNPSADHSSPGATSADHTAPRSGTAGRGAQGQANADRGTQGSASADRVIAGTVTVHQITVGTTEGDDTEITSGVSPGDILVMSGVDKLQEGSKVTVHFADQNTGKGT
jgi:multidrug efflux system membrane fusion protein